MRNKCLHLLQKLGLHLGKFVFVHAHAFCEGTLSLFNNHTKVSQVLVLAHFLTNFHTVLTHVYLKDSKN